jgi:hypothetical protein
MEKMSVRETLQKKPAAAGVAALLLILACAAVILSETKGQSNYSFAGKVFYSDDDGKTWFLDDLTKGSPFDHDGKPAYRAMVYRCTDGGDLFVGFLAKFSDHQIAQMAGDPRVLMMGMQEMKKPGELKWVENPHPENGFPVARCPNGGGNAVMVLPNDPASGASR